MGGVVRNHPCRRFLRRSLATDKVGMRAGPFSCSFQLLGPIEAPVRPAARDAFVVGNGVAGMLILISRRPDGLQVAAAEMAPSSHVLLPDGRFS